MPNLAIADKMMLSIANSSAKQISALKDGPKYYPFPISDLITHVVADRLTLAGENLRDGNNLILSSKYRASISRNYYAMYHSARGIVFGHCEGDDHQSHRVLPKHLPPEMANSEECKQELVSARLLRNEADYNPYPANQSEWEVDARALAVSAANFVKACDDFANQKGYNK